MPRYRPRHTAGPIPVCLLAPHTRDCPTVYPLSLNLAAGIAAGVALASVLHAWRTGMALTARATLGLGPDKRPRKVYYLLAPAPTLDAANDTRTRSWT